MVRLLNSCLAHFRVMVYVTVQKHHWRFWILKYNLYIRNIVWLIYSWKQHLPNSQGHSDHSHYSTICYKLHWNIQNILHHNKPSATVWTMKHSPAIRLAPLFWKTDTIRTIPVKNSRCSFNPPSHIPCATFKTPSPLLSYNPVYLSIIWLYPGKCLKS